MDTCKLEHPLKLQKKKKSRKGQVEEDPAKAAKLLAKRNRQLKRLALRKKRKLAKLAKVKLENISPSSVNDKKCPRTKKKMTKQEKKIKKLKKQAKKMRKEEKKIKLQEDKKKPRTLDKLIKIMNSRKPNRQVNIECNMIAIGSYKTHSMSSTIITIQAEPDGIKFHIPRCQTQKKLQCKIPGQHIVSIQAHLNSRLPVIFLETTKLCTVRLRKNLELGRRPGKPNFYCPVRGDATEKRIVFPIKSIDQIRKRLRRILVSFGFVELDFQSANALLLESTSPDVSMPTFPEVEVIDSIPDTSKLTTELEPSFSFSMPPGPIPSESELLTITEDLLMAPSSPQTETSDPEIEYLTSDSSSTSNLTGYWWNNEWRWKTK